MSLTKSHTCMVHWNFPHWDKYVDPSPTWCMDIRGMYDWEVKGQPFLPLPVSRQDRGLVCLHFTWFWMCWTHCYKGVLILTEGGVVDLGGGGGGGGEKKGCAPLGGGGEVKNLDPSWFSPLFFLHGWQLPKNDRSKLLSLVQSCFKQ